MKMEMVSCHLEGGRFQDEWCRAATWSALYLRKDPNKIEYPDSQNTHAEFLYLIQFQCVLHEVRHYIYRRECLGEQDRRVGVSVFRNLIKGRSKKP